MNDRKPPSRREPVRVPASNRRIAQGRPRKDDILTGEYAPMAVAERIDLTRRALHMTQVEFVSRIGLGKSAYGNWMNGKLPDIRTALALCDAYDLTLDWIYRGDPSNLRYNLAEAIAALRRTRPGSPLD